MNPLRFPFALLGLLGFAMVLPPWNWFVDAYATALPLHVEFLTRLVLPAGLSLFVASWLEGR